MNFEKNKTNIQLQPLNETNLSNVSASFEKTTGYEKYMTLEFLLKKEKSSDAFFYRGACVLSVIAVLPFFSSPISSLYTFLGNSLNFSKTKDSLNSLTEESINQACQNSREINFDKTISVEPTESIQPSLARPNKTRLILEILVGVLLILGITSATERSHNLQNQVTQMQSEIRNLRGQLNQAHESLFRAQNLTRLLFMLTNRVLDETQRPFVFLGQIITNWFGPPPA